MRTEFEVPPRLPPRMKQEKPDNPQEKKPKNNYLALLSCCIFLTALLGSGIWVGLNRLKGSQQEEIVVEVPVWVDPFETPPLDLRIVETDKEWKPNAALIHQLGPEQDAGEYTIRIPEGFKREDLRADVSSWVRPHVQQWQRSAIGVHIMTTAGFDEPITETIETELLESDEDSHLILNRKIERGKLIDLPCYRITFGYRTPDGKRVYHCAYGTLDQDRYVCMKCVSPFPPDSRNYKLLETALLSVKKRVELALDDSENQEKAPSE